MYMYSATVLSYCTGNYYYHLSHPNILSGPGPARGAGAGHYSWPLGIPIIIHYYLHNTPYQLIGLTKVKFET